MLAYLTQFGQIFFFCARFSVATPPHVEQHEIVGTRAFGAVGLTK